MATFTTLTFARHFGVTPSPRALMAILWLWFSYLVVLETTHRVTIGKWLFRLEISGPRRIALQGPQQSAVQALDAFYRFAPDLQQRLNAGGNPTRHGASRSKRV